MLQNSYINSMLFNFSEKLTIRTDLGIMSTPYHNFGENSSLSNPQFFGGVELNYQLSDKASIHFRIDSSPYGNYNQSMYNRYNRYNNPFGRPNYFVNKTD